ncbi:hypothetical protein M4951_10655 [Blastopirellula sp. J2-11]|uniref:DUF7577 domain-containing protein n=1 Tax=Blastopirellula sp. J2-11 TaxID=2943192 RepID=UPI0021C6681C|nr:hypothetical protein [Blastopirellula sp. J2-11]UUO08751.1 hypothetical protein M4951_10655 [Blastopirellula sp. J2-11]
MALMNEPDDRRSPSQKSQEIPTIDCPQCGAENYANSVLCWICQSSLHEEIDRDEKKTGDKPEFAQQSSSIYANLLLFFLIPALIVIGIGLFYLNVTWLVYFVVFISLPLLAIAVGLRQSLLSANQDIRNAGEILTPIYLMFLAVFGTLGIVVLVILAILALVFGFFAALFEMCTNMSNTGR